MRRLNLKGQEGFTFLSSLIDLMMLLTLLPLVVLFYGYFAALSMEMDAKHLEWNLFSVELPSYLNGVEAIEVINNGGGVRMFQGGEEYDIELFTNLIRKQKFRQGHEIMLTGVESTKFSIFGSRLSVEVEFSNGITKKTEYIITSAKM